MNNAEFRRRETDRLLGFGRAAVIDEGGFGWLDQMGRVDEEQPRFLYVAGRFTHAYSLGALMNKPGCAEIAAHGVQSLLTSFRPVEGPGWESALPMSAAAGDSSRSAYATSFVVLAGASAQIAGIAAADDLLAESLRAVNELFWIEAEGAVCEVPGPRRGVGSSYRGLNSNMHMVEAFLAAYSAGAGSIWRERAARIARRAVDAARANSWRLPEHFDETWAPQLNYNEGNKADPFRPYGSTVGHWLEWARLLLQLESAYVDGGLVGDAGWMRPAAVALFDRAVEEGWNVDGMPGFVYTVDWEGAPVVSRRLHWVIAEAIGAATTLHSVTGEARYAAWCDRWTTFVRDYFVDERNGSWHHELDPENRPSPLIKRGKADVYHSLQAMMLPDLPVSPGLASAVAGSR